MSIDLKERIEERIKLCKIEKRSYQIWLKTLTPANFLLVGVGGVLSLLAGLSIVTEAQLVETTTAGWLAVVGAALTGLHNRLKCEPHQAECMKLANQFAELQTEYERLQIEVEETKLKEGLMAADGILSSIRASRGASPSDASIRKAKREMEISGVR